MQPGVNDTIAAIATARGRAALAIVRLSGTDAVDVAARVFSGTNLNEAPSHTAHFGYVKGKDGDIDQVVATIFRAPRSSTGEDVVELTCHGGDLAAQLILGRLLEAGARPAGPGEFTQRSFINGKLDLAQAEAIADLIHATSTAAHRVSISHLRGRYSHLLSELRQELLDVAALVELELDFSDEDVEFADRQRLYDILQRAEELLGRLLGSYTLGERIRDGVRVVIAGRPNAGKSTLMNALVGFDRAIVSPTPGTTRDEIEAEAEINGLRFRFVDTAGIRSTEDAIEAEGVRRAQKAIESADAVLYLFDVGRGLDDDQRRFLDGIRTSQPALPLLLIANKIDVAGKRVDEGVLPMSALQAMENESALRPVIDWLMDAVADNLSSSDGSAIVMNQRHLAHLREAKQAVVRAREQLDSGHPGDTFSLDLRAALEELGAITGEITNEDVLDQIFSRFCIGK